MWERLKNDRWLQLIAGSTVVIAVLSFIQFIVSRFEASTMELGMKMMRGMFLKMFLQDILSVAIQIVILFLLLGAGIGMFLYFRRTLRKP